MTKPIILVGAWVALFVGTVLAARSGAFDQNADRSERSIPASVPAMAPSNPAASEPGQGFIYGRVTTHDGATYEGRLRFGGGEESFWGDQFNGAKDGNPWIDYVPLDQRPERRVLEVFGFEIAVSEGRMDLSRPFMARFGDLVRIERNGSEIRVTLKTGTVVHLDRYAADDFADGVRIWDARGTVDLEESQIRSIDLLPTARLDAAPERLHGTVLTAGGSFTGFIQWDREEGVGSDELEGLSSGREARLRFNDIRSIARDSLDSSLVTLLDGREIVLSGTRNVGGANRGVYVDDRRYGRVLVPWDIFERIDFSAGGAGPAYGDFPLGGPLRGTVTTNDGRRLSGRLVYDLDESETTETLDAPSRRGVDYTLLFGLIASIVLPAADAPGGDAANVILHSGEELRLDRAGDLGDQNAGMLIFADDPARPEYLRWDEVRRIDLERPSALFPALGMRWP